MKCFPSRGLIDIRTYEKGLEKEIIIYHSKRFYDKADSKYMNECNMKFNLFDCIKKEYIIKDAEYDDIIYAFEKNKLKKIKIETVADMPKMVIPSNWNLNSIWEKIF